MFYLNYRKMIFPSARKGSYRVRAIPKPLKPLDDPEEVAKELLRRMNYIQTAKKREGKCS
jgi:hypothetical protein